VSDVCDEVEHFQVMFLIDVHFFDRLISADLTKKYKDFELLAQWGIM